MSGMEALTLFISTVAFIVGLVTGKAISRVENLWYGDKE